MKRFLLVFLLFAYLWQYVGMILHHQCKLYTIRREAKEIIKEKKKQVVLVFDEHQFNSLNYLKLNKEFKFQDKLYDIISIKRKKQFYHVNCYEDKKETKERFLFASKYGKLKESSSKSSKKWNGIIKINTSHLPIKFFCVDIFECGTVAKLKENFYQESKSNSFPSSVFRPPVS